MEPFMLENAALYHSLVQRFQAPRSSHSKSSSKRNDRLVVTARLRPNLSLDCPIECLTCTYPRQDSQTVLDVHELQNRPRWGPALRSSSFETDRIFTASETNKQIFDELMTPLIDVALTGGIATLFAYGQTGSGKTYTINGLAKLTAEALVQSQATHHISVCAIEIIGGSIYDLLNNRGAVKLLENSHGRTTIHKAKVISVSSAVQLVSLLENAGKTRCSAETLRNSSSSRSHAIYRLTISRRFTKDSVIDESTKAGTEPFSIAAEQGSLYLVDLAGSEIARDTSQHTTERLRETILINTSLAALKDCIRAQARSTSEKSERKLSRNPHVPFRRAVLTRVLKHVFEPTELRDTRSAVIACINPNVLDVAATKNTLKYSEMLRNAVA